MRGDFDFLSYRIWANGLSEKGPFRGNFALTIDGCGQEKPVASRSRVLHLFG